MPPPKLGRLLFKRSGIAFRVESGVPASLEIGPYVDEAILWGKKTGLSVLLGLPKSVVMIVEATSDKQRLVDGWLAYLAGSTTPYLGGDYSAAHRLNQRERARRLRYAPRTMTTSDSAGWTQLKQKARGNARTQIELAERWARFMEEGQKKRMESRDTVYTSLYLADGDGYFNPNTRAAVLEPLRNYWPFYEGLIREHLDDF